MCCDVTAFFWVIYRFNFCKLLRYLNHCKERESKKKKNDEADETFDGDQRRHLQIINEFNKKYDALHYVTLLPRGQNTWGFYMPQEIPKSTDKKYKPRKPFRDHTCSTNVKLENLCNEYGLLIECPREARIQQIEEFEKFRDEVTLMN